MLSLGEGDPFVEWRVGVREVPVACWNDYDLSSPYVLTGSLHPIHHDKSNNCLRKAYNVLAWDLAHTRISLMLHITPNTTNTTHQKPSPPFPSFLSQKKSSMKLDAPSREPNHTKNSSTTGVNSIWNTYLRWGWNTLMPKIAQEWFRLYIIHKL